MAYLYKLTPSKKGSDYMIPVNTTYTKEYADSICDFYLIDEKRYLPSAFRQAEASDRLSASEHQMP